MSLFHLSSILFLIVGLAALGSRAAPGGFSQHFETSASQNYTISKGTSIRIPCVVQNRQGECLWLHDGVAVGRILNKYDFQRTPSLGDCSITIYDISLGADDGRWQCQVTSLNIREPPLQSSVITVTVLIAPEKPQIKRSPPFSREIRVFSNTTTDIECSVAKGNPASKIYWSLNGQNITEQAKSVELRSTDQDSPTFTTTSYLKYIFFKDQNNFTLNCLAVHPLVNQTDSISLDVLYIPTVSIPKPKYSVKEGFELIVHCKVDSNPPAKVLWKRFGNGASINPNPRYDSSVLYFERVSRDLNGEIYECIAQNEFGFSEPSRVTFDVLFPPHLLNASLEQSVKTGKSVRLYCNFDGNPRPSISWFHKNPRSGAILQVRTSSQRNVLDITEINYTEEGEYYCEASNVIDGKVHTSKANKIVLDVYGLPAFISKTPVILETSRGSDTRLTLWFCSDPPPSRVNWQFGSINLPVHATHSNVFEDPSRNTSAKHRIEVLPLVTLSSKQKLQPAPNCYESTLSIKDTDSSDERDYNLLVENQNGIEGGLIKLRVVNPLSATLMVAAVLAIIVIVFVVGICTLLLSKRKKKKKGCIDEEIKDDAQVLSNSSAASTPDHVKDKQSERPDSHELVYANLEFEKGQKPGPPPIRPKPQIRPSHIRQSNGTEYAKLAFPSKADL